MALSTVPKWVLLYWEVPLTSWSRERSVTTVSIILPISTQVTSCPTNWAAVRAAVVFRMGDRPFPLTQDRLLPTLGEIDDITENIINHLWVCGDVWQLICNTFRALWDGRILKVRSNRRESLAPFWSATWMDTFKPARLVAYSRPYK